MVDILLTGTVLISSDKVVHDGYVYVKDGVIEDIGESPVPEDYTFAGLILGGRGRIIAPGLVGLIDALAYPIRLRMPDMADRLSLYTSTSSKELALAALPAVYEAHMNGITTLIIEGVDQRVLDIIEETVGGRYYLAMPACHNKESSTPRVKALVAGTRCLGDAHIYERNGWGYSNGSRVLALFTRASYSLTNLGNVYAMSHRLAEVLGLEPPVLRKGRLAEIVVYNTIKPPAMMLYTGDASLLINVYSSGARVESLVIGNDVLVDIGEHLYISDKQLEDSRKVIERLTSR